MKLTIEQKLEAIIYAKLMVLSHIDELEKARFGKYVNAGICGHLASWLEHEHLSISPSPSEILRLFPELRALNHRWAESYWFWWNTDLAGHLERSEALDKLIDHLENHLS